MQSNLIPVTYREPFAIGRRPWHDVRPQGQSVLEIVRSVPNLPQKFLTQGIVLINGEEVPREMWSYIRPKCPTENLPIAVTLHLPLHQGGQGGGRKSIIGLVAAIALIAVAAAITGGAAGGLLYAGYGEVGFFAAGSTSAQLLAGAVTIAGSLAIAALTKPPTAGDLPGATDTNTDNRDAAAATGNIIAPGGSIPRVIGSREVFPPIVAPPVVEQISDLDEQVSVVFALNGPHDINNVYIDGTTATGMSDVSIELRNGEATDTALTTIVRQGRTLTPNITLSQHIMNATQTQLLSTSGSPTTPNFAEYPQWHRFTANDSPDDILIQLFLPGGIGTSAAAGTDVLIPFRMRVRQQGTSTWINLPEFHLAGNAFHPTRRTIRLRWGQTDIGTAVIPTTNGWYYLYANPPAQSISPTTAGWSCDVNWQGPSGNEYAYNGTEIGTKLRNYNVSSPWQLDFLMNTMSGGSSVPKGRYEIEIMRGMAYFAVNFNKNNYQTSGNFAAGIHDFFASVAVGTTTFVFGLMQNQTSMVSQCLVARCVSMWNSAPVDPSSLGKFAYIGVVAKNRNIQRLSCDASGRVHTLVSGAWTGYGASSNPAAHYRDVLIGAQNHDPLSSTLVDDAKLQSWFAYCASPPNGPTHAWTVDAIIDDMRTQDVLDLIASCGYSRPYQSDFYGVVMDIDRSLDPPIQVFSRINTANMQFSKAFAKAPAGMIINYHNKLNAADSVDQVIVNQSNPSVGTTGLYETISYDGLVDAAKVTARGQFDLDQANLRSTFYTFDADIESIVCRRGDLVALQHDVLTLRAGDAHIKTVVTLGGNITGFVLDSIIPCVSGTGIAIRRQDGTISTHAITNTSDTNTITLTTPFAIVSTIKGYDDTGDEYGCLIVSGDIATVYKRMLVQNIQTKADLKATITLVDEAPALVRY